MHHLRHQLLIIVHLTFQKSILFAIAILNRLYNESCGDILRSQEEDGETYNNVFQGSQLVDWMIANGEATSRDEATRILRRLLQSDVIRHGEANKTLKLYY